MLHLIMQSKLRNLEEQIINSKAVVYNIKVAVKQGLHYNLFCFHITYISSVLDCQITK